MWPCAGATSNLLLRILHTQEKGYRLAHFSRSHFTSLTSLAKFDLASRSMPCRYLSGLASLCHGLAPSQASSSSFEAPAIHGRAWTVGARHHAARLHTSCTSSAAQALATIASSGQAHTERGSRVNRKLQPLVLRGPAEPGSMCEGYAPEMPADDCYRSTGAECGPHLDSIDEAAILEEAAQELEEKQQRDAERQGRGPAANSAVDPSASDWQQSAPQRASEPRSQRVSQLRVGDEVDLICQSLAFGGQVCSL